MTIAVDNSPDRVHDGFKMTNTRTLDADQLAALVAFAASKGRTWKHALRDCWYSSSYSISDDSGSLQRIRNAFGPTWLKQFSFTNIKTHSVKT